MPVRSSKSIPVPGDKPLTPAEQAEVILAFKSPGLWAFVIAAGMLGFRDALDACATRELPDAVVAKFASMGDDADSLPPRGDVDALVRAYRLTKRKGVPPIDAEGRRALVVAQAYGLKVPSAKRLT